jgi:hypothetical protein
LSAPGKMSRNRASLRSSSATRGHGDCSGTAEKHLTDGAQHLPGGIHTGIATTTQLPVFYRFSR